MPRKFSKPVVVGTHAQPTVKYPRHRNRAPSKPKSPVRKPATRAQPDDRGIVVSIGPTQTSRVVKEWMTFPLTPESIPITVSATWNDVAIVGRKGGQYSNYAGRNLDTMSFSGQLEPPVAYVATPKDPWVRGVLEEIYGDAFAQEAASNDAARSQDRIPHTSRPPTGGDQSVIMDSGARAGPNHFFDPHAFKEIVSEATRRGEPVKLVIGDAFGWSGLATIREFSWRYEDVDPDVLYFDITFTEHRERSLMGGGEKKAKSKTYTTHRNDTLRDIAEQQLGSSRKWDDLARLNKDKLAKLWITKEVETRKNDPDTSKNIVSPLDGKSTITHYVELAHEKRVKDSKKAPKRFEPDILFEAGIKLRLRK